MTDLSRRNLLRGLAGAGALLASGPLLAACGSSDDAAGASGPAANSVPHLRHLFQVPRALVDFSSAPMLPQLGHTAGTGRFHVVKSHAG